MDGVKGSPPGFPPPPCLTHPPGFLFFLAMQASLAPAAPGPAPSGGTLESLDVDLGWFARGESSDSSPKVPLGAKNLFLLAARECWRDGRIDARDNELLKRLQQALRLPPPVAAKLFQVAAAEYRESRLPPNEALDRAKLFRKAYRMASRDGRPARAHALLHRLGAALRIRAGTIRQALIHVASMVTGDRGQEEVETPDLEAADVAAATDACGAARESVEVEAPPPPEALSSQQSGSGFRKEAVATWRNRKGQLWQSKGPVPRKLEPEPVDLRARVLGAGLLVLVLLYVVCM